MASLRDVLNHVGRPFRLHRGPQSLAQGLATLRGSVLLMEPKAEPQVGDAVEFDGVRLVVESVAAEAVRGRLDHYRLQVRRQA